MDRVKLALIGVGGRGEGLYRVAMRMRDYVDFIAVCDVNPEKTQYISDEMEKDGRPRPIIYEDYKKCIDEVMPDAVVIATGWVEHIEISIYAMERKIPVATEIGCGYSIEQMWDLVKCYERTKTPFMTLENCCYGRMELLALNMKRQNLLGEIFHCECGYRHNLWGFFKGGEKFRFLEYQKRNSENYPTHGLGPVAKLLDINCGNRFVSLVSVGSKSVGLNVQAERYDSDEYKNFRFTQSDVLTTIIKCQNGETITMNLDTNNPRWYSRDFLVEGTKCVISEQNNSVFLDGDFTDKEIANWTEQFNNAEKYYQKYSHRIWENYNPEASAAHGGMDMLVFDAFFDALRNGKPMPIDVYDFVSWHVVTVLSEQSMATGQIVAFPDFTNGKWLTRKNTFEL